MCTKESENESKSLLIILIEGSTLKGIHESKDCKWQKF